MSSRGLSLPQRFAALWSVALVFPAAAGEAVPKPAPKTRPVSVSVAEFENRNPLREDDWFGAASCDLLVAALSRISGLEVLERSALEGLETEARLDSEPVARTAGLAPVAEGLAHGKGSAYLVGGWFDSDGARMTLEVRLSEAARGQTVWREQFQGRTSEFVSLCRQAARGLLAALPVGGAVGLAAPEEPALREVTLAAAVSYYRGRSAQRNGAFARALADFLRAARKDPRFLAAWREAGKTLELLGRPAAALAAYAFAIALDPDDPAAAEILWQAALLSEDLPDPQAAPRLYQRLQDEYPLVHSLVSRRPLYGGQPEFPTYGALARERTAHWQSKRGQFEARFRQLSSEAVLSEEQRKAFQELHRMACLMEGRVPDWHPANRMQEGETQTLSPIDLCRAANQNWEVFIAPLQRDQALRQVEFTWTPVPGGGAREFPGVSMRYLGAPDPYYPPPLLPPFKVTGGNFTLTIPVVEPFTVGFEASLRPPLSSARPEAWSVRASLRPLRPGVLFVQTDPPGLYLKVDGVMRGATPCRVRDLAPGPHALEAVDRDPLHDLTFVEIPPYLTFHGRVVVEVTAEGETGVTWAVPHKPGSPWPEWQPLRVALRAEPCTPRSNLRAAWHPKLGWIAAWNQEGDVYWSASPDGGTWSRPRALSEPVRTSKDESLEALLIAPGSGRAVVVFKREDALHTSASNDLEHWSPVLVHARPAFEEPLVLAGAAVSREGHFFLLLKDTHNPPYTVSLDAPPNPWPRHTVTESMDGLTWPGPVPYKLPGLSSQRGSEGCLFSLADGRFEWLEGTWDAMTGRTWHRFETPDRLSWSHAPDLPPYKDSGSPFLVRHYYSQRLECWDCVGGKIRELQEDGTWKERPGPRIWGQKEFSLAWAPDRGNEGGERIMLLAAYHDAILVAPRRRPGEPDPPDLPPVLTGPARSPSAKPPGSTAHPAPRVPEAGVKKTLVEEAAKSLPPAAAGPALVEPPEAEASKGQGLWIGLALSVLALAAAAVVYVRRKRGAP